MILTTLAYYAMSLIQASKSLMKLVRLFIHFHHFIHENNNRSPMKRCHDIQDNDTKHNDTLNNDTLNNTLLQNGTLHNDANCVVMLNFAFSHCYVM
jgi:hypothetical protein